MRIYIDNEIPGYHKIVDIRTKYNKDIYDDLDSIIDALKALGYMEDSIIRAFTQKCVQWGVIEPLEEYND